MTRYGVGSEHQLQVQCVAWARWQGMMWPGLSQLYNVRNEGKRSKGGHAAAKSAGLRPGIPDLHLPVGSRGFHSAYCELKRPGKKPTRQQIKTMRELLAFDNFCFSTDDFDYFKMVMAWYLGKEDEAVEGLAPTTYWYLDQKFFVVVPRDEQQGRIYGELPY